VGIIVLSGYPSISFKAFIRTQCQLGLLALLLLVSGAARAVVDIHQFEPDEQRQRYGVFIDELRCPKCQNQNLSGSNSPIASDLRQELHRLITEGRSDDEIVEFMVARYGEFILYEPRLHKGTALLWFTPLAVLVLGGGFVIVLVRLKRRQTANSNTAASAELSQQEQQRLDELLGRSKQAGNETANTDREEQ